MENEPYDPHATGPMPPRTPTACRDFASGNSDNEKIWSAFFRNFTPWMRRLAKEILVRNGLTPDDADDVVMIAAEKFTNNAIVRRNAPNGHLRPLVRRVARNTAYDYLRKNGPIRERRLREGADPDDTPAQTDDPQGLRIAAMSFILENVLRPDFPNGEYCAEYDGEILAAFRCISEERDTLREIASAANIRLWKAQQLKNRAWSRLIKEGEAPLASLGLI